ncbi:MAG: flavodoxin family protein [Desulfobacteraceae bacterium]|jgi:multimeric flavodoxin WrbA
MKVLAINGSPRKDGNTAIMIKTVLEELEKEGIETELLQFSGKTIQGCKACLKCFENKDNKCVFENDDFNQCFAKMIEADGIILGSPTYFTDVTSEMKGLIDRAGFVSFANGRPFKRKTGAAVVAVRRAGSIHVFDTINHFFFINEMMVPGSSYWNMGIGREKGEVAKDEEGLRTMKVLGKNMAWMMKRLYE